MWKRLKFQGKNHYSGEFEKSLVETQRPYRQRAIVLSTLTMAVKSNNTRYWKPFTYEVSQLQTTFELIQKSTRHLGYHTYL